MAHEAANTSASDGTTELRYSTLYFGYASNMSPTTMKQRCPDSMYVGIGRLDDYRWMINKTHYANIVPSPGDVVYGALFFLSHRDEGGLDRSEGVPWMYQKQWLPVTRLDSTGQELAGQAKVDALSYVDVERLEDGRIEKEYIIWINKAIRDGVLCGVPQAYVDKYLRPYTPLPTKEQEVDIMMVRTMEQTPARLPSQISKGPLHG